MCIEDRNGSEIGLRFRMHITWKSGQECASCRIAYSLRMMNLACVMSVWESGQQKKANVATNNQPTNPGNASHLRHSRTLTSRSLTLALDWIGFGIAFFGIDLALQALALAFVLVLILTGSTTTDRKEIQYRLECTCTRGGSVLQ